MNNTNLIDYYGLLRISADAEDETIERVYAMLADRYHPDNPDTGDPERFQSLQAAHQTLTEPHTRASYDAAHRNSRTSVIQVFKRKEFAEGIQGEANRRMGVLCLLYNRRRSDSEKPGISLLQFEALMQIPREHLMFTLAYLKDHNCLNLDQHSDYVITGTGIDFVESHVTPDGLFSRLLEEGEAGRLQLVSVVPPSGVLGCGHS